MDRDQFLKLIAQIESSSGQNTNHQLIHGGHQKGQRAIGDYGLLPNTIQEFVQRNKNSENKDPVIAQLEAVPQQKYADVVSQNPFLEQHLASAVADHVIDKNNGDLEKAAWAWNNGHNKPTEKITDAKLDSSPYVSKFRSLIDSIAPSSAQNPTREPASGPITSIPQDQISRPQSREVPDSQIKTQTLPNNEGEINTFGNQDAGQLSGFNMPKIAPVHYPVPQDQRDIDIDRTAKLDALDRLYQWYNPTKIKYPEEQ